MEFAHTALAFAALILGAVQIAGRKAGRRHRLVGRAYVAAMALTALSSFFLTSLTGGFSFLHALSAWTLFTLAWAMAMVRRGNLAGHGYSMIMLYGGLVTAGFFAAQRHGLDLPATALVTLVAGFWIVWIAFAEMLRRRLARRTADLRS
ncbi:DUF2306 domain-containing protein [Minwuia thermotolerans]|uniref:DUF2306 domain-containing protein n=1 Tax=Minwuia thermotolerans TaxID=2056226 RepID=A0A2M9G5C0_9PROT|nr:DUF2306 domain-containing protein [Minwuia thermotolerans]PJK30915.1 hypothetical protein CVT23_04400 [Minwuia thermotolerans]